MSYKIMTEILCEILLKSTIWHSEDKAYQCKAFISIHTAWISYNSGFGTDWPHVSFDQLYFFCTTTLYIYLHPLHKEIHISLLEISNLAIITSPLNSTPTNDQT